MIQNGLFYIKSNKSDKILSTPANESVERYVVAQILGADKDVLDVGSKRGVGALILYEWAKSVTCSDVINQLELDFPFYEADWVKDNVEDIIDKQFDVVTCMEVIEHVDDPGKIIKNIAKVLKPNGILVLSTPSVDRVTKSHIKPYFTKKEVKDLLDPYFEVIFIKILSFVSWFCVARLRDYNGN